MFFFSLPLSSSFFLPSPPPFLPPLLLLFAPSFFPCFLPPTVIFAALHARGGGIIYKSAPHNSRITNFSPLPSLPSPSLFFSLPSFFSPSFFPPLFFLPPSPSHFLPPPHSTPPNSPQSKGLTSKFNEEEGTLRGKQASGGERGNQEDGRESMSMEMGSQALVDWWSRWAWCTNSRNLGQRERVEWMALSLEVSS